MTTLERTIVLGITEYTTFSFEELKELIRTVKSEDFENVGDLYLDTELGEFRIIHEDAINDIWEQELEDVIKDCYDLGGVPEFVVIDWGKTVENCKVDGMGHHFSVYDGGETYMNGYYFFRTN